MSRGLGDVYKRQASEPKEIINKYAKEGYSYVGFIPTLIDAHGGFRRIDLIFEK